MASIEGIQQLARPTLSERVAIQILEMISRGEFKRGERIPTEPELCKALGVGRSTIREAITSLTFVGVLKVRSGEGTFVGEGPVKLLDQIVARDIFGSEEDIVDLVQTRLVIETETVGRCAQLGTERDFLKLQEIVVQMGESVTSGSGFLDLDLEFHMAIARGSQNRILAQLLSTIRGLLGKYIVNSLTLPESARIAHQQHTAILHGLMTRDPRKARSAMKNHLQTFQKGYNLLKVMEQNPPTEEKIAERDLSDEASRSSRMNFLSGLGT